MFTWTAEDSTGAYQRAARVQVAEDEAFCRVLFDSGLREGVSSLGFAPEIALRPRTRYWWRVEVVADDGDRAVSEAAWFETGKRGEPWSAKWIRAPFEAGVHPILSRGFELPEKPARARIYAVGLGVYELTLNGSAVGDEVLAPFYNDYNLWIQAQAYDVTELLRAGENRLEAWLGNGWYRGRFGFDGGAECVYGDHMQLILELRAEMPDGSEFVLGSDEPLALPPLARARKQHLRRRSLRRPAGALRAERSRRRGAAAGRADRRPPVAAAAALRPHGAEGADPHAGGRTGAGLRPGDDRLGGIRLRPARGRAGRARVRRALAARQFLPREPALGEGALRLCLRPDVRPARGRDLRSTASATPA